MGKSVLELAVGTGKWDAGLKKAKSALDNFIQANGGLNQALDKESQKMSKFIQMMGGMESKAKTAKGQMSDYKNALESLTMQYNRLNDAQKKSFGQDYLHAIDQLKQKYRQAGEELKNFNESLSGSSNAGVSSSGGFGGAMEVFKGNLMTKAAMVAADFASQIGECVTQGIELAKQGEGVRIAFERLGRGDIMDGLREATHGTVSDLELMKAAVRFKDFQLPLEELGTMLAFAQQKAKDTGQSVDYMVESIVTGLGRKSKMILDNLGISAAQIDEEMAKTGDMTKAVGEIIRKQMSEAGEYIETAADRATKADVELKNAMEDLGRTLQPMTDAGASAFNSMKVAALNLLNSAIKPLIAHMTTLGMLHAQYDKMGGGGKVSRMIGNLNASGNKESTYQQQQAEIWRYINRRENYMKDRNRWINTRDEGLRKHLTSELESFGAVNPNEVQGQIDAAKKLLKDYQKAAESILHPIKQEIVPEISDDKGKKKTKGGKGGANKNEKVQTELQQNQTKINALTQEYVLLGDKATKSAIDRKNAIRDEISQLNERNGKLKLLEENAKGKLLENNKVQTEGLGSFSSYQSININSIDPEKLKKLKTISDLGKTTQDSWKNAASAISSIGGAISSIEDPAAKIMGTIGQAIATIALAYSESLAKDPHNKQNIWYFIATAAAATVSMAQTIASIHSATGYAQGGMIPGNSYSGDQMPAMVNSGELILNRAQQGNVASQLQDNAGRGMHIVGQLRGEDIILVANRTFRRKGQGEIVTW